MEGRPMEVKEDVWKFFEDFGEEDQQRPCLNEVNFKKISSEDNSVLISRFGEEEIKETIWDCGSSKSLGLDRFNFKFIKEIWHILKSDIVKFLDDFPTSDNFTRGTNASFIALIPTIEEQQGWWGGDYRSISLVGCMYKVVAKVLAKRLQKVLHGVIDERQCAFLGGRNLFHCALIANEVVDEARRKKKKCMILKVDYEKMYDSICWKFLFYMTRRLCFDKIWIGWIYGCLSTSSIFILVNGSPLREFKLQRDLRQDNPLAPFLFTMVVEGLSGMTREACHKNIFEGYRVGVGGVEVSLLQYTNDTFLLVR